MNEIILDIIKFSLPAFIVFLTVFTMLSKQNKKEERLKILALQKKYSKESLPLKLQAFERLTLLMHRIAPENLIPRIQTPSMDVKMFSFALQKTIKSELEHNITQQIYVSDETWNSIQEYKGKLIHLIQEKTLELKSNDTAFKLAEAVLTELMNNTDRINYQEVMGRLKSDVKAICA